MGIGPNAEAILFLYSDINPEFFLKKLFFEIVYKSKNGAFI